MSTPQLTGKYKYYASCVGWPRRDVDNLVDMIDSAITLTRATFLKHVDRDEMRGIEQLLGYESHPAKGLTMAGDYSVSYHRSRLNGHRVYFFRQSGVEHVFTKEPS